MPIRILLVHSLFFMGLTLITMAGCSHSPYEEDFAFEDDWTESEDNFYADDSEVFDSVNERTQNRELLKEEVEALQNKQEVLISKARELEETMFMLDVKVDTTQERIEERLPTSVQSDFIEQDIEEIRTQVARLNDDVAYIQSRKTSVNPSRYGTSGIPLGYTRALSAYRSGKYEESILNFRNFAKGNPQKNLKDNIEFWIGCNYAKLEMYDVALRQFKTVLRDYPDGNKVHDSRYMLGLSHYYNGRSNRAIEILEEALRHNPPFEVKNKIVKQLNEIQKDVDSFYSAF